MLLMASLHTQSRDPSLDHERGQAPATQAGALFKNRILDLPNRNPGAANASVKGYDAKAILHEQ